MTREETVTTAQVSVNYTNKIPEIAQAVLHAHPQIGEAQLLREIGRHMDEWLLGAADVVAKLVKDGWRIKTFSHTTFAQHSITRTEEQVAIRLAAIGIDPASVIISTTWDIWSNEQT